MYFTFYFILLQIDIYYEGLTLVEGLEIDGIFQQATVSARFLSLPSSFDLRSCACACVFVTKLIGKRNICHMFE